MRTPKSKSSIASWAATAAAIAPRAVSKTLNVESPSPRCFKKRPPERSTAAAMSSSWPRPASTSSPRPPPSAPTSSRCPSATGALKRAIPSSFTAKRTRTRIDEARRSAARKTSPAPALGSPATIQCPCRPSTSAKPSQDSRRGFKSEESSRATMTCSRTRREKWALRGSNPRPPACKTSQLDRCANRRPSSVCAERRRA